MATQTGTAGFERQCAHGPSVLTTYGTKAWNAHRELMHTDLRCEACGREMDRDEVDAAIAAGVAGHAPGSSACRR